MLLPSPPAVQMYFDPLIAALKDANMPVTFETHVLTSGGDNRAVFASLASAVKGSGDSPKVAVLEKEVKKLTGESKIVPGWLNALEQIDGAEQVNALGGMAICFAMKDGDELKAIKRARAVPPRAVPPPGCGAQTQRHDCRHAGACRLVSWPGA